MYLMNESDECVNTAITENRLLEFHNNFFSCLRNCHSAVLHSAF